MSDRTRVLVVDDEPLAREALITAIAASSGAECVAQAWDAHSCIEAVRTTAPEVIFLDINMPETDAFVLVAELATMQPAPLIVFVTAYSEHAVRAFEHHAVDYIVKPFNATRIDQAIEKAKESIRSKKTSELLRLLPQLLQARVPSASTGAQRLAVKTNGRILFLDAAEVQYIEADGNYVLVHCGNGSHLLRETLHSVEQVLSRSDFIRIHRSIIVNARYVREVQPWPTGEYILRMRNGKELTVTRKYKQNLARIASLGIGKDLLLLS